MKQTLTIRRFHAVRPFVSPAASNGETVVVRTAEGWMLNKINPETRTIYSGHGKELWQRKLTDTDRVLGVYLGVVRRA